MAIIHRATLTPTKIELVRAWLDRRPWGGLGDPEVIGSYRFDDPNGHVGIEAMLIRRGDEVLHVPVTYRGAPLEGAEEHLIGTTQHSVLGERWVYHAAGDPVALACFDRALRAEQEQAVFEIWDGDTMVGVRDQTIQLVVESGASAEQGVHLARVVGDVDGAQRLVAAWGEERGTVAAAG